VNRYILQGHKAVLVDRETYINQQEKQDRTVAKSTIGNYLVSTVFPGLDHQWHAHGPPLLFETMVFGKGELDERQERCTTWEEAEAMHETMCEEVRQQVNKEQSHCTGPSHPTRE
jgi:hypothetical protein